MFEYKFIFMSCLVRNQATSPVLSSWTSSKLTCLRSDSSASGFLTASNKAKRSSAMLTKYFHDEFWTKLAGEGSIEFNTFQTLPATLSNVFQALVFSAHLADLINSAKIRSNSSPVLPVSLITLPTSMVLM